MLNEMNIDYEEVNINKMSYDYRLNKIVVFDDSLDNKKTEYIRG